MTLHNFIRDQLYFKLRQSVDAFVTREYVLQDYSNPEYQPKDRFVDVAAMPWEAEHISSDIEHKYAFEVKSSKTSLKIKEQIETYSKCGFEPFIVISKDLYDIHRSKLMKYRADYSASVLVFPPIDDITVKEFNDDYSLIPYDKHRLKFETVDKLDEDISFNT